MILDGIICPTDEMFGHIGPPVTHDPMREEQRPLLVIMPVRFLDAGVEVVVPPLSTLLSDSVG